MKNRKVFFAITGISLILILSLLFSLAGCGSDTTTTTTTQATQTTPTSTAEAKTIVLKVPTTAGPPPSLGLTLTQTELAKLIETSTSGRVKLDIYWSETLAKGTETVNALETGIADFAYLRSFAEPGKIPLCTASELPGISNDNWALLNAYWDLMNQPEIAGELDKHNLKPICSLLIAQQNLISRTPIRTAADIKGKKIAASGVNAEIIKGIEGVPLAMSPAEQYEGITRGTVDAIVAPIDAIGAFKFFEGAKFFTQVVICPRMHPVVMNKDTWNKLSAADQKIFTDLIPKFHEIAYDTIMVQTLGPTIKTMQDNKVEFISFNASDEATVQAVRVLYAEKWAADMEAKGLPGKKVLSDYKTFAAKYEQISPYKK
jgi:TRAP-type transport system periplasmic protein